MCKHVTMSGTRTDGCHTAGNTHCSMIRAGYIMPALFVTAFEVEASFHACMRRIHEGIFQSWERHEWDGCLCLLSEFQARKNVGRFVVVLALKLAPRARVLCEGSRCMHARGIGNAHVRAHLLLASTTSVRTYFSMHIGPSRMDRVFRDAVSHSFRPGRSVLVPCMDPTRLAFSEDA